MVSPTKKNSSSIHFLVYQVANGENPMKPYSNPINCLINTP